MITTQAYIEAFDTICQNTKKALVELEGIYLEGTKLPLECLTPAQTAIQFLNSVLVVNEKLMSSEEWEAVKEREREGC